MVRLLVSLLIRNRLRNVRMKQKGSWSAFERKRFQKRESIMLSNDRPFKRCQFEVVAVSFDIYVFEKNGQFWNCFSFTRGIIQISSFVMQSIISNGRNASFHISIIIVFVLIFVVILRIVAQINSTVANFKDRNATRELYFEAEIPRLKINEQSAAYLHCVILSILRNPIKLTSIGFVWNVYGNTRCVSILMWLFMH